MPSVDCNNQEQGEEVKNVEENKNEENHQNEESNEELKMPSISYNIQENNEDFSPDHQVEKQEPQDKPNDKCINHEKPHEKPFEEIEEAQEKLGGMGRSDNNEEPTSDKPFGECKPDPIENKNSSIEGEEIKNDDEAKNEVREERLEPQNNVHFLHLHMLFDTLKNSLQSFLSTWLFWQIFLSVMCSVNSFSTPNTMFRVF